MRTSRERVGLSQDDLAQRIHSARSEISRWESGARIPRIDIVTRIADALKIDVEELSEIAQAGTLAEMRVAKELRIVDVAEVLGVSPAWYHRIETGGAAQLSAPNCAGLAKLFGASEKAITKAFKCGRESAVTHRGNVQ